jgi:hypothetical protein|tara:strand:+ start:10057 stop:10233 length:177 start_codon:yes stop_codon:yes gene_type:complete
MSIKVNGGAGELDDDEAVTEWVTPFGKATFDPKKGTIVTEHFHPRAILVKLKKKYRKS